MSLHNFRLKSRGTTLVSTLVALGIAGVLVSGMGDFLVILDRHQKQSELKAGTQELESLIRYALKNPATCNKAVGGATLNFDAFNISPFEMNIGGQVVRSGSHLQNGAKVLALQLEDPVEVETNYYSATLRLITTENQHESDQRFVDERGIDYDRRKRNLTLPLFFVAESALDEIDGCATAGEVVAGEDPKFAPLLGDRLCHLYAQENDSELRNYNKDASPNCIVNRFVSWNQPIGYRWGDADPIETGVQLINRAVEVSGQVIVDGAVERVPRFGGENLGKRFKACFANGEGCPEKTSPKGLCTEYQFEVTGYTVEEWRDAGYFIADLTNLERSVSCQIPGERIYDSRIVMTSFTHPNFYQMQARVISKRILSNTLTFKVDWFNPNQKAIVDLKCCKGAS